MIRNLSAMLFTILTLLSNRNAAKVLRRAALCGLLFGAFAFSTAAQNLIVNGDFTAGNSGFTSNYGYQTNLVPETKYYVGTNPRDHHASWASFGDHTTGSGKMMIVNGDTVIGSLVWKQTNVSVATNTSYDFTVWAASSYPTNPTVLDVYINNVLVGTINCTATTGQWVKELSLWNSGSSNLATIEIKNRNSDFNGNDFVLDDISMAATPVADLRISKSHSGSFVTGSTGTYTLSVANSGTAPTSGTITVTDTLPAGLSVNGGAAGAVTPGGTNAANWSCNSNAASPQVITCTSSTAISNSGSNTSTFGFAVGVAFDSAGSVTNNASVSGGGEATANNGNNTAADITPVITTIGCSDVYATGFSGGRNSLYKLVGATMTPIFTAPQIVGGLAISANGSAYYDDGTFANPPLFRFDGTTQTNTGMTLPNLNVGEAADAAGNVFYIDTAYRLRKAPAGGSGAAIDLGAITFEAGDAIGPQLRYGDMAIDGNGRLYWYSSIANGAGKTYLYQVSPSNVFPAKSLGNIGPDGATGAAFDAAGKLITTNSAGQVYSIDVGSSTFAAVVVGTASPSVYDLGSCVQPNLNPNLTAAKAVANITKAQNPAVNASSADVLEYTITVTNNGNLPTVDATLADAIPTGTTYVAASTTLNGVTVADASGAMPYATAREISSTGQPAGVITAGNTSIVVKFRVTVNSGSLPATINNTGSVAYPKVFGGANTPQTVTTNTTSTPILSTPPNIGLVKSVTPDGTQLPGTELTYSIAFTNSGGAAASNFRLTDPDPSNATLRLNTNTDFKVGSVTNTLGTTGLVATVAYSNDNGVTYAYTPVSGGGGAPAGFDRNVTHIRWSFAGSLSPTAPNNAGSVSFVVRIR